MSEKMTQTERLDFLVETFKADSEQDQNIQTPTDENGKRRILRSLMNIRLPRPMAQETLQLQDEYLHSQRFRT